MTFDVNAQIRVLCQQIAEEKDTQKFLLLVQELNDLLEKKAPRIIPTEKRPNSPFASQS